MKKIIIMAAAMLFSWQGIQAQNDNAEDNDDVITVTTRTVSRRKSKFLKVWKTTSTAFFASTIHRLT